MVTSKRIVSLGIKLTEAQKQQVAGVDPRVEVQDLTELLRGERRAIERGEPVPDLQALNERLGRTEVLFTIQTPRELPTRAPRLRWVHFFWTGIERLLTPELAASDIQVTHGGGVTSRALAEYALCAILMHLKRIPTLAAMKARKEWPRRELQLDEASGKTVAILGLGSIGREVAALCKALGMRVLATRRHTSTRQEDADGVDVLYPSSQLTDMLREADFLVLAAPLTRETKGLIGKRELLALRKGAYIVNVARGEIVDEEALIDLLQEGHLSGAALDVFQREPLPPESPLWEMPNVLITPHAAAAVGHEVDRGVELFCNNLRRFLRREPFLNVVDKSAGY
ncbi:MAG: D-2-hydroxyacid dehydrogenase [Chloroflexi bacterium]|nr:D-2-hydroxyacid dehydrogenase [Chloroflexota bacterium]